MKRIGNKVSYIRKPLAKNSLPAAGLAAASLILTLISVWLSYKSAGNAPLWAASVGFSGILMAAASIIYGILAIREKEKNYLLAKISLPTAGAVGFIWLVVVAVAAF